jgi:cell division septation protein DedD
MTAIPDSNGNSCVTNRRSERRQKVLFSSVVMHENKCGRLLDISPKGLALQTGSAVVDDEFPNFRFNFSPTLAWVSAKGRVVWRDQSKNVVGIEFIGLTDEVQGQIRTWMDSKKDLSGIGAVILGPAPAPETISASATGDLVSLASKTVESRLEDQTTARILPLLPHTTEKQDTRTAAKSARFVLAAVFVGLGLLTTVLVAAFLLPRLHLRELSKSPNATKMAPAPHPAQPASQTATPLEPKPSVERPAVPPPQAVASAPVSAIPSPNREPNLREHVYVLQVAAMIHEENAIALEASLRQVNFPVFISKKPTDRFHHVLVGPFNAAKAAIVTSNLEKRGFQAVRTEWKAESQ